MSEPVPFSPVPSRKEVTGWTVLKQRNFIAELAASGSVSLAAQSVGMSARSAWRLRHKPGAEEFSAAWSLALRRAGAFLLSVAVDRAVHGTRKEIWKDGKLIATQIAPSDRLLMFAIDRLTPGVFGTVPTVDQIVGHASRFQPLPCPEQEDEQ